MKVFLKLMNKNQWFILSITFWILMFLFIKVDSTFNCDMFSVTEANLDKSDIWCVVNSEIYDPFIWLFPILAIAFFVCGWLEPKKNKIQRRR